VEIAGKQLAGIGLGTAQFAFRERSRAESLATVRAALDGGIRLIDTALAYTHDGVVSYAEELVGEALRDWGGTGDTADAGGAADAPIVATKGGHYRDGDGFPVDARPEALRAHCLISLAALGVERIDLYQLHKIDPRVPLLESVEALAELRREGLIAAIGLSNVTTSQLDDARAVAPIASVQNRLSTGDRADLVTVADCESRGIAYLAYMPFGGPDGDPGSAVAAIALARGVSTQRVQLAWLRALSPNVIPLVGASRPASILDSARYIELDAAELAQLAAVSD
jgi:aryl-alcohol dehydrogenase-like predicted oxidoreductase